MQRYDIINYLLKQYSLSKYLEIGVFHGDNIRRINADIKHGVDPGYEGAIAQEVTHKCTSNEFFECIPDDTKYDLIFIDGLHHAKQVVLDIKNSLKHTSDNGYILLHDCIPPDYNSQVVPRKSNVWTGDVWRAFVGFRSSNKHTSYVIDTDLGVGVIKKDQPLKDFDSCTIAYEKFAENKIELLNLVSVEKFLELNI